ncbi:MAG TPA: site-specific DNA-methyltransferase [Patescibacteria group bacterium]|nr:site-specific DNA-methyltransferase [Patescibacteria group bacterium]
MARRITKPAAPTSVEAVRHTGESRVNIPTAELGSLAEAEATGPQALRYPRDPSLDPQLVWKGKDEQDGEDLVVPAVPIHIQEQISPKAIIEDLREASAGRRETQLDLFSGDFNGMAFEERVDFYRHPMKWSNRMILGDSLLVMGSLAEKEGLKGQVQTIYLDPPYGIKFGSNWQVSTRKRDVKDGKAEDATRQPEQVRAFRDTWELGIHSYLSYLRDRLVVARELLTESGSIFVQIGDENVHLVRSLLDEVFGSENFCGLIAFTKTSGATSALLPSVSDYLLWYGRDRSRAKYRSLFEARPAIENPYERYICVETPDGRIVDLSVAQKMGNAPIPEGRLLRLRPTDSQGASPDSANPVRYGDREYYPPRGRHWSVTAEGMTQVMLSGRAFAVGNTLAWKSYRDEFPYRPRANNWTDINASGFGVEKIYIVQTLSAVVARSVLMTTDPGDLVLDPTCGSGTTAYVAEQWGRRWITIDTSRVALALARTRLMAAKYPYYLLADTPEGQRREAELTGAPPLGSTEGDIRKGFVYERVPHVTLKSIAQNPEIRDGMTRAEIDAAIARHADTEILFDRPYTDPKVVRVAGPFTVESLSPHRVVADGPEDLTNAPAPIEDSGRFVETILDNLRASGVDNRTRGERLRFETLDPFPGRFLQATGTFREGEAGRRVAVAIGPQYGTVGPDLVRQAALETGGYFDVLVVCGFAFDALADESTGTAMRLGKLTVLTVRMNPDLAMADDLLKKTRAGNLFTVFGKPDIAIRPAGDGELQVEIRGLDVYDPTTGVVRSNSTDDIACWFIDTAYDDQQFFVRHAYFLGADDPYDRLKRALRADIDEAAWASLNATVSRPFARPASGRIAVKVINHYGDEILKVYGV